MKLIKSLLVTLTVLVAGVIVSCGGTDPNTYRFGYATLYKPSPEGKIQTLDCNIEVKSVLHMTDSLVSLEMGTQHMEFVVLEKKPNPTDASILMFVTVDNLTQEIVIFHFANDPTDGVIIFGQSHDSIIRFTNTLRSCDQF